MKNSVINGKFYAIRDESQAISVNLKNGITQEIGTKTPLTQSTPNYDFFEAEITWPHFNYIFVDHQLHKVEHMTVNLVDGTMGQADLSKMAELLDAANMPNSFVLPPSEVAKKPDKATTG